MHRFSIENAFKFVYNIFIGNPNGVPFRPAAHRAGHGFPAPLPKQQ
jgi:hypothetical protein